MKKLKWKKSVRKAPAWLRTWKKNNDRIEFITTNIKFGGFRINITYNGFSLYRFKQHSGSCNIHIGTFIEIEKAKQCAQLIHNG